MAALLLIPGVIMIAVLQYFAMPVYNLSFIQIYIMVAVSIWILGSMVVNQVKAGIASGVVLGLAVVLGILTSNPILNASRYRNLIGEIKVKELDKSLPPIKIDAAPLVSRHMAEQAAQKKLSNIPALGSQVVLGELVKQSIGGKLYWVSFLEHSGVFQWNNTGFTPGYVKVSATNVEDVELVQEIGGKKLQMRFIMSAYLGDYAERRIYSEVKTLGITDFSPEVDDEGHPFIVASLVDKNVGFSGADTVSVAVLNVQTGSVKVYKKDEAPAWIDRVHPEHIVYEQITDWGHYVNGWFNPSNKDQLMVSDYIDLVYGEDGHCYFYLGITSVGKDNGIVGFMLVNSRTKETTLYYVAGANEEVAAKSAEDVMPEKKYHSTNPLPFSVNGVPTYIMTLTDQNGIPRAYAMVNIQHYQTLAVSDSLKNTYQLYLNKLAHSNNGTVSIDENRAALTKVSGIIDRIANDIKNGTTVYYLTLKNEDKIFSATSDLNEKLVLSKSGDTVEIQYEPSELKIQTMNKFENQNVK